MALSPRLKRLGDVIAAAVAAAVNRAVLPIDHRMELLEERAGECLGALEARCAELERKLASIEVQKAVVPSAPLDDAEDRMRRAA